RIPDAGRLARHALSPSFIAETSSLKRCTRAGSGGSRVRASSTIKPNAFPRVNLRRRRPIRRGDRYRGGMEFVSGRSGIDLTYSDVFLVPRRSAVTSRLQVDLTPGDGNPATITLVASNMNSVTCPRL